MGAVIRLEDRKVVATEHPMAVARRVCRELGAGPMAVYVAIADRDHGGRGCWVTNAKMAEELGMSPRSVQRHKETLEDFGFIRREDLRQGTRVRQRACFLELGSPAGGDDTRDTRNEQSGRQTCHPGGVTRVTPGTSPVSPKETPPEPPHEPQQRATVGLFPPMTAAELRRDEPERNRRRAEMLQRLAESRHPATLWLCMQELWARHHDCRGVAGDLFDARRRRLEELQRGAAGQRMSDLDVLAEWEAFAQVQARRDDPAGKPVAAFKAELGGWRRKRDAL
ncbi:MAG: helix-turn-helix domain-containing protein [Myxococcota bacterium]